LCCLFQLPVLAPAAPAALNRPCGRL